jgi:predicted DNA-binding WGR domain protein
LMAIAESAKIESEQLAALMALGRMGGDTVAAFLARLAFSAGGGDADDDSDEDDEDEDEGPSPDVSMPGARRFEFEEDDSAKFWEVVVNDNRCTVRFGRIGTVGQKKPKELADADAAQKEMQKLIREKTNKGYEEVEPRGVTPPKAVPSPTQRVALPEGTLPWGTPGLRAAAFRALRRAQRTNQRRAYKPKWFSESQLQQLEANPALAESMLPPAPPKRDRASSDGYDDGDDDDYDDE